MTHGKFQFSICHEIPRVAIQAHMLKSISSRVIFTIETSDNTIFNFIYILDWSKIESVPRILEVSCLFFYYSKKISHSVFGVKNTQSSKDQTNLFFRGH